MKLSKFFIISIVSIVWGNGHATESTKVSSLQDICQTVIGMHTPSSFTSEIIRDNIPEPIIEDLLQKRQLPIEAPTLTFEVITSLINNHYWQDQWGYKWQLIGTNHSDLSLLKDRSEMPSFTKNASGDHTYEYGASIFYEDFDPVDYVERWTSTYVTISLKLQ